MRSQRPPPGSGIVAQLSPVQLSPAQLPRHCLSSHCTADTAQNPGYDLLGTTVLPFRVWPFHILMFLECRHILHLEEKRMWKIGAIIKVLSRGCGRAKQGVLKATSDGSSELSTFHLLSTQRLHSLIPQLMTQYCNCLFLSSLTPISLRVSGGQGAYLSAFCIFGRSLPRRYCGFCSRPPE